MVIKEFKIQVDLICSLGKGGIEHQG